MSHVIDLILNYSVYFACLVVLLSIISTVQALSLYVLIERRVSFKESFKLVSVASALNKILLTGSGYFASSYLSRNKNLPFHQAMGAFILLEVFSVSLWLAGGMFFGAELAFRMPIVFIAVIMIIIFILLWRSDRAMAALKSVAGYCKSLGLRSFLVIPFLAVSMCIRLIYYAILFRMFGFITDIVNILKIVSISFAAGYLSPAPAGLGVKDAGMTLLLKEDGVALDAAISIAVFDRFFVTAFWGILGVLVGFDLIKREIARRRQERRSAANDPSHRG